MLLKNGSSVLDSKSSALVKKAEKIRVREHRLKPSLRLKTQTEIIEFIHEKGLVSVLGGNELPSFISAILGKPWKPSAKGFTGWLDWWSLKISGQRVMRVSGEIERREDILASRVFRRSKTFISNTLWPILDSIVKHHWDLIMKREVVSDLERKLLETIDSEGSIRTDELRRKLRLDGRANNSKFHRSLVNLESYALIVGAEDPHPEKHLHANIWQTWNTRTGNRTGRSRLSYKEALAKLLEKTIESCILAREDQIGKWFQWSTDMQAVKQEVMLKNTMLIAGEYLISSRVRDLTINDRAHSQSEV